MAATQGYGNLAHELSFWYHSAGKGEFLAVDYELDPRRKSEVKQALAEYVAQGQAYLREDCFTDQRILEATLPAISKDRTTIIGSTTNLTDFLHKNEAQPVTVAQLEEADGTLVLSVKGIRKPVMGLFPELLEEKLKPYILDQAPEKH